MLPLGQSKLMCQKRAQSCASKVFCSISMHASSTFPSHPRRSLYTVGSNTKPAPNPTTWMQSCSHQLSRVRLSQAALALHTVTAAAAAIAGNTTTRRGLSECNGVDLSGPLSFHERQIVDRRWCESVNQQKRAGICCWWCHHDSSVLVS